MQEINLLQNKLKDTTNHWENNNRAVIVILGVLIIAELVAGAMFFMLTKSTQNEDLAMQAENADIENRLAEKEEDVAQAKGFQAQSKNINLLLQNHVVWNSLMDSMAAATFQASRYLNLSSDTTGRLQIEGRTPTYSDLGRMLLSLETNPNLESVRLISTAPSEGESAGVIFSVEAIANPSIFLTRQ